jgi:hypothetical protein
MDRDHSRIIILLLGGVLFVLVFGREAALFGLNYFIWAALAVGVVALIVWAFVAVPRYLRREAIDYREEVRRDRQEGRPWLYTFIAWPGAIGNFIVFGAAAYSRFEGSCRSLKGDCLENIPYWWVPVAVLLVGVLVQGLERLYLKLIDPTD